MAALVVPPAVPPTVRATVAVPSVVAAVVAPTAVAVAAWLDMPAAAWKIHMTGVRVSRGSKQTCGQCGYVEYESPN